MAKVKSEVKTKKKDIIAPISPRSFSLFVYACLDLIDQNPNHIGIALKYLKPFLPILKKFNYVNDVEEVIANRAELKERIAAELRQGGITPSPIPLDMLSEMFENFLVRMALWESGKSIEGLLSADRSLKPEDVTRAIGNIFMTSFTVETSADGNLEFELPEDVEGSEFIVNPAMEWGRVHVIVAPPKTGKTRFALNAAIEFAKRGHKVKYISLELTLQELFTRLLFMRLGTSDKKKLRSLSPEELKSFIEFSTFNNRLELVYADPAIPITTHFTDPHTIYFVDFLNLLVSGNTYEGLGKIVRSLVRIARDLNSTVIAMTQANRQGDIAESYQIVMSADAISFLSNLGPYTVLEHRFPRYYDTSIFSYPVYHGMSIKLEDYHVIPGDILRSIEGLNGKVAYFAKKAFVLNRMPSNVMQDIVREISQMNYDEAISYLREFLPAAG